MVRTLNRLNSKKAETLGAGMHADGGGLWLRVQPGGRSWLFRFKSPVTGRERLMGLGTVANVSLAEARKAATAAREELHAGKDPLEQRRIAKEREEGASRKTFRQAAEAYIAAHKAGWKNAKHGDQWQSTLEKHVFGSMGDRPVVQIDTTDVMKVLEPVWTKLPETATRLRGRIELILDYATAKGWRTGDNPARWRGHIAHMLPRRSKVARVVHHPALPYSRVNEVMGKLASSTGTGALAVRFVALTAARSGEARGAKWSEIDLEAKVWIVPAARMKASREHRVPLSQAALEVLRVARSLAALPDTTDYVFPGAVPRKPLSDVALSKALAVAAGDGFTVHGLRSTFRDWCGETTTYPGDVAEAALAHQVKDKVEAAYRRGDLFDKRRALMDSWGAYAADH